MGRDCNGREIMVGDRVLDLSYFMEDDDPATFNAKAMAEYDCEGDPEGIVGDVRLDEDGDMYIISKGDLGSVGIDEIETDVYCMVI